MESVDVYYLAKMRLVYTSLIFLFLFWACSDSDEIDCSTLRLELRGKIDPTTCSPANGEIKVAALGGLAPYVFKINESVLRADSLFSGLQGGVFFVTVIDNNQCEQTTQINLTNFNTDLAATFSTTEDTGCVLGTGTATILPQGGQAPYQVKHNAVTKTTEPFVFEGLKSGISQFTVIDSQLCEFTVGVAIPKGKTSVTWSSDIKPIIETRCAKATCHVAGTGRADLSKFDNVKQLATEIKARTQNGSMPFDAPMSADQIQLIACWVDDGALDN